MAMAVYIAHIFIKLFEADYPCCEHLPTSDQNFKKKNGREINGRQ
jgi:hypothetical protein